MPFPVDNIRRLCALEGITLAELERELKIGNGVIARWENKKTSPPYDRLKQIADRFGVTIDQLSASAMRIGIGIETQKPASVSADGLDGKLNSLSPELREQFVRFLSLAKADPEKAARYLAFANQELEDRK